MEILNRILQSMSLRGTVYFQADFRAPWGMDIPGSDYAIFHMVVKGECWVSISNKEPAKLAEGAVLMFPRGTAHAIGNSVDAPVISAKKVLETIQNKEFREFGGCGDVVTLVCGHFSFDSFLLHPLIQTLPEIVLINPVDGNDCLSIAAKLAASEAQGNNTAVVDRLAEVLFIKVLQNYSKTRPELEGFLAALASPRVATALKCIHQQPAKSWTVGELAEAAGISRSSFAEEFRNLVGISPVKYLMQWRMMLAQKLLKNGKHQISQIADQVGFESEFSFSRAFKRHYGVSPKSMKMLGS